MAQKVNIILVLAIGVLCTKKAYCAFLFRYK